MSNKYTQRCLETQKMVDICYLLHQKNGTSSFKLPAEISKSSFGNYSPHSLFVDGLNMARGNEITSGCQAKFFFLFVICFLP